MRSLLNAFSLLKIQSDLKNLQDLILGGVPKTVKAFGRKTKASLKTRFRI